MVRAEVRAYVYYVHYMKISETPYSFFFKGTAEKDPLQPHVL